jgi:hypothetical protein
VEITVEYVTWQLYSSFEHVPGERKPSAFVDSAEEVIAFYFNMVAIDSTFGRKF